MKKHIVYKVRNTRTGLYVHKPGERQEADDECGTPYLSLATANARRNFCNRRKEGDVYETVAFRLVEDK